MRLMIFCNVAWLPHYRGESTNPMQFFPGLLEHGEKQEEGWERWNFKTERDGNVYGYAPTNYREINLERIGGSGDYLTGVDVVFASNTLNQGDLIVGWYSNATVYRRLQSILRGIDEDEKGYNFCASPENVVCIPVDRRTYQVPRAQKGVTGWMGQHAIWYADSPRQEVRNYVYGVRKYVADYPQGTTP